MSKLKCNSAAGPDGLPPIFFSKTKNFLNFPLSIMYRTFIDLRIIPTEWKLSIITPIFKKGSPSDPANYRPIALTCICCKIMESIIANDLLEFLSNHNLITKHQHGFLKKHSTSTNLLESLMCYNIVHGCCALRFDEFFTFSTNPVTRGHSLKLSVPLCKSNIRKNFFAVRVVPIWNSLPQQIVSANSPAAFKNQISKYDFSLFLNFPCVL